MTVVEEEADEKAECNDQNQAIDSVEPLSGALTNVTAASPVSLIMEETMLEEEDSCSQLSLKERSGSIVTPLRNDHHILPEEKPVLDRLVACGTALSKKTKFPSIVPRAFVPVKSSEEGESSPIALSPTREPKDSRIRLGICAMDKKARSKPMAEVRLACRNRMRGAFPFFSIASDSVTIE
jgi:hypothetical protein